MSGGTERKCFSSECKGLIQVIQITLQLKSGLKTDGKGVERRRPARMAGGAKD
jgi:hypothetical protein